MRVTDPIPGIIHEARVMDIETLRAQRQQELKDIAEWRMRRLQQIIDWSDPVKREQRKAQAALEREQAEKIWAQQVAEDRTRLQMHEPKVPFADRIMMTVITKAPGSRIPWWRRLLAWLKR